MQLYCQKKRLKRKLFSKVTTAAGDTLKSSHYTQEFQNISDGIFLPAVHLKNFVNCINSFFDIHIYNRTLTFLGHCPSAAVAHISVANGEQWKGLSASSSICALSASQKGRDHTRLYYGPLTHIFRKGHSSFAAYSDPLFYSSWSLP